MLSTISRGLAAQKGLTPLIGAIVLASCGPMKSSPDTPPPLLVEADPAPGAQTSPGAVSLRFTFDQPMMDKSWSLVRDEDQPFPEIADLQYSPDRKVLTVQTVLRPNTTYQFWLNHGEFRGFRSADNVPLHPYRYRVMTAAD